MKPLKKETIESWVLQAKDRKAKMILVFHDDVEDILYPIYAQNRVQLDELIKKHSSMHDIFIKSFDVYSALTTMAEQFILPRRMSF
jgi:hypothetical protein